MQSVVGSFLINFSPLQGLTKIEDVKSLQSFLNGQLEAVNVLHQRLIDDAKALVDLGTSFKTDFDVLAKESSTNLTSKRPLWACVEGFPPGVGARGQGLAREGRETASAGRYEGFPPG